MLGKDIFFFFFFAESRSGLHIWDVNLTSSNCRILPPSPLFLSWQVQHFPNQSVCIQQSGFCSQEVLPCL